MLGRLLVSLWSLGLVYFPLLLLHIIPTEYIRNRFNAIMMWKIDHPPPRYDKDRVNYPSPSALVSVAMSQHPHHHQTLSLWHANVPFVGVERLLSKDNIHNNVGGEHGKADHRFWVRNHSSNCWGSEGSIMYPSCECLWSSVVET